MALRYSHAGSDAKAWAPRCEQELITPRLHVGATEVTFRRGGSFRDLLDTVNRKKQVMIDAAPGAGKSTKAPRAIAHEMQVVVYHILPGRLLARHLYLHVKSLYPTDTFHLSTVGDHPKSPGTVVITDSATLIAQIQERNDIAPGSVAYFDESHDSDCYSYVLRHVVHHIDGFAKTVFASATHQVNLNGGGFRGIESGAIVKEELYDRTETADKWEVSDFDKPWSATRLDSNTLIFVDSDAISNRLINDYGRYGIMGHRLTSRTSDAEFARIMQDLYSESVVTVIMADSSYRSGFNFPLSCVIDSGWVPGADFRDDGYHVVYRKIFEFEAHQARNRLGRFGQSATYYRPDFELSKSMCHLGPTDIDAAVLLFHAMGFQPPILLQTSVFFAKPQCGFNDAISAFNSPVPLRCQRYDEAVVTTRGFESLRETETTSMDGKWLDWFATIQEFSFDDEKSYLPNGIPYVKASDMFPLGGRSIDNFLKMKEVDQILKRLRGDDAFCLIQDVNMRRNQQVTLMNAIMQAMQEASTLSDGPKSIAGRWAAQAMLQFRSAQVLVDRYNDILLTLMVETCEFVETDKFQHLSESLKDHHLRMLYASGYQQTLHHHEAAVDDYLGRDDTFKRAVTEPTGIKANLQYRAWSPGVSRNNSLRNPYSNFRMISV